MKEEGGGEGEGRKEGEGGRKRGEIGMDGRTEMSGKRRGSKERGCTYLFLALCKTC